MKLTAGGRGGGGGGGGRGGGGGGGFQCAGACEIKVAGNTFTITRMMGDQTITSTLNAAGDATNKVTGRGGEAMDVKTTGKWDGNKVVFSTTRDMGGTSVTPTYGAKAMLGLNPLAALSARPLRSSPLSHKFTYYRLSSISTNDPW